MAAENIVLRGHLELAYGLGGMVPCGICGRAIWPTPEYEAAVEFERTRGGRAEAVAALPALPNCGDHPAPKKGKR